MGWWGMGRRSGVGKAVLLVGLLALPAVFAVPGGAQPVSEALWAECAPGALILGYSDGLDKTTYDGIEVGGLSALAHDAERDVYYALVDIAEGQPARFYTLVMAPPWSGGFRGPVVVGVTTLVDHNGMPYDAGDFDGEGMAVTPRGTLLIASETEPTVREFSRYGRLLFTLPVPERFRIEPAGDGQPNLSLEGVTVTPGGAVAYASNEAPLLGDGEGQNRFLRYDLGWLGRSQVAAELYYQSEPGESISDILALSETELLVLERSYIPDVGNTARLYLASTAGATDASGVASLAGAGIEPLPKELLVDLVDCPSSDAVARETQPNPLLDNYDGLALGPVVDGRYQTIYLISDDNFNPAQVTRVIALGIDLALLGES